MDRTCTRLVCSLLALLLCVSMLAGTTFAWFTDTDTVGVNTIQAGRLQLQLLDGDSAQAGSLEGRTLDFVAADGRDSDRILWEPGASYRLQPVWLYNAGNLHASYQLLLNGIQGSAELAQVLQVYVDGQSLGTLSQVMSDGGVLGPVGRIAPDTYLPLGEILLKMDPQAGNRYQGQSLTGLAVLVRATQAPVEYDSYNNTYDQAAAADWTVGQAQLLRDGQLMGKFETLAQAVAAAQSGDSIVLTGSMDVTECALVDKDITIDGGGFVLHRAGYAGTVIQVAEGAALTLANVTVDGDADGFAVDYTLAYPAVSQESLADQPLCTSSAVVSYGQLRAENVTFRDHYSYTVRQAPLQILRGSASVENCAFTHNYGHSQGGAVFIGDSFRTGQTAQSVGTAAFVNCSFTDNYTRHGNGGAVCAINAETVSFTGCSFLRNMAASYCAGGGAVLLFRDGLKPTENNGLPYMQAIFNDCLFQQNYSGNDGFAIDNECGELTVENCRFVGNVGLAGNSSVGTISEMHYSDARLNTLIRGCSFTGNNGAAAVYGDHASLHNIVMEDCTFAQNTGSIGILLYSSDAVIRNCRFENENTGTAVMDFRAYNDVTQEPLYPPMNITLQDVTVTGSSAPGVLIRKYGGDLSKNATTVTVTGNSAANVTVQHGSCLQVAGTLTGDILYDQDTPAENIRITGTHNGTLELIS